MTGYPYDAPPPVRDTCDHCGHKFQREADDHRPTCAKRGATRGCCARTTARNLK
jgi:hypothetical protein